MSTSVPTLKDIQQAHDRIRNFIHRTPVLTSSAINAIVGAELYFKCENLQKVGAFKIRGATNAVQLLDKETASLGVATASSGNHGAGLASAAKTRGIPAFVVMPNNSSQAKVKAVAGYGAEIIYCEPTMESREGTLAKLVEKTGASLIHPYNDYRIIAGQGTAIVELLEEVENLEIILAPIGGGGLIGGTALAAHYIAPKVKVFGAEPAGADDAYQSFKSGKLIPSENPNTIADGLRASIGEKPFGIIKRHVTDIVTVSEESIVAAMRTIWERMKIIVEPSGAVPLAALLEKKLDITGKRVGIILSGGNIDLDNLPW